MDFWLDSPTGNDSIEVIGVYMINYNYNARINLISNGNNNPYSE